ncbi:tyrosine-type recombinase/integrase, partial [Ottowia sp.]|uniref:tyrosine-type recombinase/integrase n=1 Tax=Ottowia sp. TaxID=1898956 RepID=UPI002C2597D1
GRSERTAGDYRQKLHALLAFLGDRDVTAVTVHDLRRYVADMRSRETRYAGHAYKTETTGGLAPASLATRIRAVKRLFNWLASEGAIEANPAHGIKMPKPPRGRQPKAISEHDLRRMIEAARADARDLALVLFLADTGCRRGGLVGLRLGDLEIDHGRAWVTEKGDKRRAVFLSPATIAALRVWLAVRPAVAHDRLWLSHSTGEPLTGDGVAQLLARLGKRAGCTGPHGAHSFRHGFARQWIMAGGDMGTLADVMGHAEVSTTWAAYAVFTQSELQARHARFSPISKLDGEHEHGYNGGS